MSADIATADRRYADVVRELAAEYAKRYLSTAMGSLRDDDIAKSHAQELVALSCRLSSIAANTGTADDVRWLLDRRPKDAP